MKKEEFTDWAMTYFRNRDLVQRRIVSIEKTSGECDILIKHNDKEIKVLVMPEIESFDALNAKLDKDKHTTLVTLNSKNNFDIIVNNWKYFVELPNFYIVFSNPDSSTETKWIINPHVHSRIADEKSLKIGLKSMFDSVERI